MASTAAVRSSQRSCRRCAVDGVGRFSSRSQARQLVLHGTLLVNGKPVNIPSFLVRAGDAVELREKSRKIPNVNEALDAAARRTRPGGVLVYSTCSIEPEECGDLARALARKNPRLKLVRDELTLPGGADEPLRWRDGGYTAIFEVR